MTEHESQLSRQLKVLADIIGDCVEFLETVDPQGIEGRRYMSIEAAKGRELFFESRAYGCVRCGGTRILFSDPDGVISGPVSCPDCGVRPETVR